jgi:hypothetical protein
MGMSTTYSFERLANDHIVRARFFKDYDRLIQGLKKHGYAAVAAKHARNKKRIEQELVLLD